MLFEGVRVGAKAIMRLYKSKKKILLHNEINRDKIARCKRK